MIPPIEMIAVTPLQVLARVLTMLPPEQLDTLCDELDRDIEDACPPNASDEQILANAEHHKLAPVRELADSARRYKRGEISGADYVEEAWSTRG